MLRLAAVSLLVFMGCVWASANQTWYLRLAPTVEGFTEAPDRLSYGEYEVWDKNSSLGDQLLSVGQFQGFSSSIPLPVFSETDPFESGTADVYVLLRPILRGNRITVSTVVPGSPVPGVVISGVFSNVGPEDLIIADGVIDELRPGIFDREGIEGNFVLLDYGRRIAEKILSNFEFRHLQDVRLFIAYGAGSYTTHSVIIDPSIGRLHPYVEIGKSESLTTSLEARIQSYYSLSTLLLAKDSRADGQPRVFTLTESPDLFAQKSENEAFFSGVVLGYAALLRNLGNSSIQQINPNTENSMEIDFETNFDGWLEPNANVDGLSDIFDGVGARNILAIASLIYDCFDGTRTRPNDFDDIAQGLNQNLLSSPFIDSLSPPGRAAEWLDVLGEATGGEPELWGLAMNHGMTQDRTTRPTIGVTRVDFPYQVNLFGSFSAEVTVSNFGSQPFVNFDNSPTGPRSLSYEILDENRLPLTQEVVLPPSNDLSPIEFGTPEKFSVSVTRFDPGMSSGASTKLFAQACFFDKNGFRARLRGKTGYTGGTTFFVLDDMSPPTASFGVSQSYFPFGTQPRVTVKPFDLETGVVSLELAVGSSPGGTEIQSWQTIAAPFDEVLFEPNMAGIPNGTGIYVSARMVNGRGLAGISTSGRLAYGDATPPVITLVDDLGRFQTDRQRVQVVTSVQEDSAITRLEYCVSSGPNFGGDLVPWTTFRSWGIVPNQRTLSITITRTGLSLPNSRPYYVGVRWTNAEGLSTQSLSDGRWVTAGSHLTGKIQLEDLERPEKVGEIPVVLTWSGAAHGSTTVMPSPSGDYAVPAPVTSGALRVTAKAPTWLRAATTVTLTSSITNAPFTLINGDVDGDNAVTIFDYIRISDSFGSETGDAGFDAAADLDKDGAVTIFDYIILSKNFGLDGEE